MGVSENIRHRRIELGLSQQELADKLGYKTRSTITKIENGENHVPKEKLAKFARALDTTTEYLITGINKHFETNELKKRESSRTIAIVLAGGKSTRNQQNVPNQFINVLGKPVIIYVLEAYQNHPSIDDIYIICLQGWESVVKAYAEQYKIEKLRCIIPAGETGTLSVKKGLEAVECNNNDIIVIQESTRPLVTQEMISKLLNNFSGAVAVCEPMEDRVMFLKHQKYEYVDRRKLVELQSPEAYRYEELEKVFKKAEDEKHKLEESCCSLLMYNLNYELNFVEGNHNNIKIIRQEDIVILSSLLKGRL